MNKPILCLLTTSILLGCQSKHTEPERIQAKDKPSRGTYHNGTRQPHKDGPPKIQHNKEPKAITPKAEPYSRYGNPSAYTVSGQKYQVLKTGQGYKEKGIASWYGTKFHQRRTSSGEPYDLFELTAAHKTLPLPSYVKVKNLENGRELIVKVNDRGPFHEDRIIDLSYGAAKKLGYLSKGTAYVEVQVIDLKPLSSEEVSYVLQLGAFSHSEKAQVFLERIKTLTQQPVYIENYNTYQVVKAGPFKNKADSDAMKTLLASHGVTDVFSMMESNH